MPENPSNNPLTEGLSTSLLPQPCSVVIFGGGGDLSRRRCIQERPIGGKMYEVNWKRY